MTVLRLNELNYFGSGAAERDLFQCVRRIYKLGTEDTQYDQLLNITIYQYEYE